MIEPKKSLGQHWLSDAEAIDQIACSAELTAEDTVLEIGPGLGALTQKLVHEAGQVVAVELDEALATSLRGVFAKAGTDNLTVVQQDIMQFDLTALPPGYKVVANIPYYITGKIIKLLCETPNPPERVVLLVQKEVAERVCAAPGAMSILAVTTQFYFDASLGEVVPAAKFTPPPKVDSQAVILKRRPEMLFPDTDPKEFFHIVKAGFSSKRKTLHNALAGGLRISKPEALELLKQAGLDPQARAQTLSMQDWHKLYVAARPKLNEQ